MIYANNAYFSLHLGLGFVGTLLIFSLDVFFCFLCLHVERCDISSKIYQWPAKVLIFRVHT